MCIILIITCQYKSILNFLTESQMKSKPNHIIPAGFHRSIEICFPRHFTLDGSASYDHIYCHREGDGTLSENLTIWDYKQAWIYKYTAISVLLRTNSLSSSLVFTIDDFWVLIFFSIYEKWFDWLISLTFSGTLIPIRLFPVYTPNEFSAEWGYFLRISKKELKFYSCKPIE